MTLRIGIGCTVTILAVTVGWFAGASESRHESLAEEESIERQLSCAELYPPDPDREWDDELEEYVPINWEWRECMGVGRK